MNSNHGITHRSKQVSFEYHLVKGEQINNSFLAPPGNKDTIYIIISDAIRNTGMTTFMSQYHNQMNIIAPEFFSPDNDQLMGSSEDTLHPAERP